MVEYINIRRITLVKRLLAFTDLRDEEIADETGFNDPTYLPKLFMKIVGMTQVKYGK